MERNIIITATLQEQLEQAWKQRQVILFSAPCGCGKSAVASVLLEGRTICC